MSCEFFFQNPRFLLRTYSPSYYYPSTLASRVQEKGIKKMSEFRTKLPKILRHSHPPSPRLWNLVSMGEGRQKMSKLPKISRKSSIRTSSHRLWSLLSRRRG